MTTGLKNLQKLKNFAIALDNKINSLSSGPTGYLLLSILPMHLRTTSILTDPIINLCFIYYLDLSPTDINCISKTPNYSFHDLKTEDLVFWKRTTKKLPLSLYTKDL